MYFLLAYDLFSEQDVSFFQFVSDTIKKSIIIIKMYLDCSMQVTELSQLIYIYILARYLSFKPSSCSKYAFASIET